MTYKIFHPLLSIILFVAFAGQAVRNAVGWLGYGLIVVIVSAIFVYLCVKTRNTVITPRISWVVMYLLGALTLSSMFSSYLGWSLLGVLITVLTGFMAWFITKYFRWSEIKFNLWVTLLAIVASSLVLEVIIAVTGTRLLPLDLRDVSEPPAAYYWIQGVLFEGGAIQGIVGNRNLLGFIALLVFVLSIFNRELGLKWKIIGIILSLTTILLTRSATITVALASCLLVAGVVWLIRKWKTKYERTKYVVLTFFTGLTITGAILLYQPLTGLLNREPDMTNRFDIWGSVWELALQKPITGWGWLGHWVPGIEPFAGLAVSGGVTHLHAHNAYLDVLFQTGVIGLFGFLGLILLTGFRAWKIAVERGTRKSMVPLMLLIVLLVQGVAESRLLLEGNLLLLLMIVFYVQKETPGFTKMVKEYKGNFTGPIRTQG